MATTTQPIPVQELIQLLSDTNKALLEQFVALLGKIASSLTKAGASAQLQGEGEELLRMVIDTTGKSIEHLLSLQEQLQVSIIESYFTGQD